MVSVPPPPLESPEEERGAGGRTDVALEDAQGVTWPTEWRPELGTHFFTTQVETFRMTRSAAAPHTSVGTRRLALRNSPRQAAVGDERLL